MNENKKIELTERMVEDAIRAAREQGWGDAAEWGYRTGYLGHSASKRIKDANPHRATQKLPTEPNAVITPAYGHESIEATAPASGNKWRTKEAVLGHDGLWYGVWRRRTYTTHAAASAVPEEITPGTWKVEDE